MAGIVKDFLSAFAEDHAFCCEGKHAEGLCVCRYASVDSPEHMERHGLAREVHKNVIFRVEYLRDQQ
jgi:hypothetical protein